MTIFDESANGIQCRDGGLKTAESARGLRLVRGFENRFADLIAHAHDLQTLDGVGAARHHGFFFLAVRDPDLTVEALAVPAEVAVRDLFGSQELQSAKDGVVFGNVEFPAADVDLDEAVEGFENVIQLRCVHSQR